MSRKKFKRKRTNLPEPFIYESRQALLDIYLPRFECSTEKVIKAIDRDFNNHIKERDRTFYKMVVTNRYLKYYVLFDKITSEIGVHAQDIELARYNIAISKVSYFTENLFFMENNPVTNKKKKVKFDVTDFLVSKLEDDLKTTGIENVKKVITKKSMWEKGNTVCLEVLLKLGMKREVAMQSVGIEVYSSRLAARFKYLAKLDKIALKMVDAIRSNLLLACVNEDGEKFEKRFLVSCNQEKSLIKILNENKCVFEENFLLHKFTIKRFLFKECYEIYDAINYLVEKFEKQLEYALDLEYLARSSGIVGVDMYGNRSHNYSVDVKLK